MKTVSKFFIFILVLLGVTCCDKVKNTVSYMANVPVFMSREDFKATTRAGTARELKHPGKICVYGDYLFINEVNEGIHVIDNTNPSAPRLVSFIEIMGNVDLAAKDGILYADNLVDLLLFDISAPNAPTLKSRIENVFEGVVPSYDITYPISKYDPAGKIIVGWEQKTVKEDIENAPYWPCRGCYLDYAISSEASWGSNKQAPGTTVVGVNGSMSRFAITDKYLYAVSIQNQPYIQPTLKIFDLENNAAKHVNSCPISFNVETLFAYEGYLFMGLSNGMQIYSIQNPVSPLYVSSSWHFFGCDPVVVSGNYAYLTVRSTSGCGQNANVLQVVDISNIAQPNVVSQYALHEPFGLGIDGNKLFVCDNGLKVFDATEPVLVGNKLLFSTSDFKGFDLIPYNNLLLVIGDDGLYQYSYSSDNQLKRLSSIPVSK